MREHDNKSTRRSIWNLETFDEKWHGILYYTRFLVIGVVVLIPVQYYLESIFPEPPTFEERVLEVVLYNPKAVHDALVYHEATQSLLPTFEERVMNVIKNNHEIVFDALSE